MTASMSAGVEPGVLQRAWRRRRRPCRPAACPCPRCAGSRCRPGADPLVVGVDPGGELVVGDDPLRLEAAQPEQPGAGHALGEPQPGALIGRSRRGRAATSSAAASRSSGVLSASVRTPLSSRLASPTSVPAGGSSISAVTPSSRSVAWHASQRTGRVTWATSRRSASAPSVTAAPSALDSSVVVGSAGVTAAACSPSACSAGAMNGVWNAPATASGMTRARAGGSSASCASASRRSGGDDLARAVAVGGVQPELLEAGEHLVGVPAEHRAHAGGLERARRGHLPAAHRGQRHGGVRGQHAGDRRPRPARRRSARR